MSVLRWNPPFHYSTHIMPAVNPLPSSAQMIIWFVEENIEPYCIVLMVSSVLLLILQIFSLVMLTDSEPSCIIFKFKYCPYNLIFVWSSVALAFGKSQLLLCHDNSGVISDIISDSLKQKI